MGPMNRAPEEALDYLEAFRRERPGPGARERNWEALEHRLAGPRARGRGQSLELAAREPEAQAQRRGSNVRVIAVAFGVALAIAAAVLLVIGGIGRGLQAARQHAEPAMQAVDDPASVPPLETVARRPGPATGMVVEPAPTPMLGVPEHPQPKAQARKPAAATPEPTPAPASSPEALAEQTRLLGRARQALAEHDPGEALKVLEQLGERFPAGALEHERRAYEAIARCKLDPPVADAAARFLADHPASPLGPRVRAACDAVAPATSSRE
jgi:hypothetical protein